MPRSVEWLLAVLVLPLHVVAGDTAYVVARPVKVLVELRSPDGDSGLAAIPGVVAVRRPHWAPRFAVVAFGNPSLAGEGMAAMRGMSGVRNAEWLRARARAWRGFVLDDPLASFDPAAPGYQWHLGNGGENGAVPGIDLNVRQAWEEWRGSGVVIGILDDAVEVSHPDIAPNAIAALHFDWLDDSPEDPRGGGSEAHGTACAGLAAGRGGNGIGISGVAPEASVAGLRMLGNVIDDEIEGAALAHAADAIHVKSSSWGPSDGTTEPDGPATLAKAALEHGVRNGRDGLGTIYVWAAGNGGADGDLANLDGYANSIYTIAVGSVTDQGGIGDYGEPGANVLISAPSSGGSRDVTTTDLTGAAGKNSGLAPGNFRDPDYRNNFSGTSASAPQVAGAVALMLEANPLLGWRDVQEILLRSGRRVPADDPGWIENGAGFQWHPALGAGLLDASAAVAQARNWQPLREQESVSFEASAVALGIPDHDPAGVVYPFVFPQAEEGLRMEHVTVDVEVSHAAKSQLRIDLISPAGTVSPLAMPHVRHGSDPNQGYDWTFMTVFHWGETLAGEWRLVFADAAAGVAGSVDRFTVTAYGTRPSPPPISYAGWISVHFTDSAAGDPAGDPDRDGIPNLLEYAAGSDPNAAEAPDTAPLEFRKYPALADVSLLPEFSRDLDSWSAAGDALVRKEAGGIEIRRFVAPEDTAAGYFRLRAVLEANGNAP